MSLTYLALALGGLALVRVATTVGIRSLAFYVPIGVLIWFLTLESGVHATLAGVALRFLTPARPMYPAAEFDRRDGQSSTVSLRSPTRRRAESTPITRRCF